MNRQQRRKMASIKATEAANMSYLEDLQNRKNDRFIELYAVAIGLAFHDLFGGSKDDYIEPLIREWNEKIISIHRDGKTFEQLRDELAKKTGVWFRFG